MEIRISMGIFYCSILIILSTIQISADDHSRIEKRQASSCREELNNYHTCLKNALDRTKLNRTTIDVGVRKCFEINQCNVPNLEAITIPTSIDADRLKQTPFKNVDPLALDQCRIAANTKARDRIRICVMNQIPTFAPNVDEDTDEDGEAEGVIGGNRTYGSYIISKQADNPSICGDGADKTKVKECVGRVFKENQPSDSKRAFDEYCTTRDECKARLSKPCTTQLRETHRLLCQCSIDEIVSSKGDDLRDEFLDCTKVDQDQRSSTSPSNLINSPQANPHRTYASSSFCHSPFDPCTWLWRELGDREMNGGSPSGTLQAIIRQLGETNGDVEKLDEFSKSLLRDMSMYNNKTKGHLGDILSTTFDPMEITRLRDALNSFSNPNNISSNDDRSILTNDQLVSDLINRLLGTTANDTEQLARVGADFFGYVRFNRSIAIDTVGNIDDLVNDTIDNELIADLERALFDFMYPYGSWNSSTMMGNETEAPRRSVDSLILDIQTESNGEDERIVNIIDRFQNPFAEEETSKRTTLGVVNTTMEGQEVG